MQWFLGDEKGLTMGNHCIVSDQLRCLSKKEAVESEKCTGLFPSAALTELVVSNPTR